jgi:hypothetical protein
MPILAGLMLAAFKGIYGLTLALFGAAWAVRITAVTILAGLYVACAITFSVMILPWLAVWAGTQFGILLGLLFPPVAGTLIASLGAFWACILAKRYTARLIKAAMGGGGGGGALVPA